MNNNWNQNDSISKLQSIIDSEIGMHSYRLARYLNDISVNLQYMPEYNDAIWGYKFLNIQDADLAQSPKLNVIKSVIDFLVSRIGIEKVRPYFTPVNGLYSTRAIVRQAQQYFDIIYEKEKVQFKVLQAFRNACIFGIGYVFYNPFSDGIEVPGTWQVAVSNSEKGYGIPTKCLVEYKNYPITQLDRLGIDKEINGVDYVNLKLFFDVLTQKAIALINNTPVKEIAYKAENIPLAFVYYNKPVFGTRTISIVDELDGIQTNIDLINSKISAATQLTPANTTYVEAGSSLQPGDISNRTGNVYSVKMGPAHNQLPVVNVTPAAYDPSLNHTLQMYIDKAYEMIGVSQQSAMSKQQKGIDSGVAIQTLEDIETDRLQTQVDNFVHAFIDLATLIIDIKEDSKILPKSINTAEYSWKDIRKQRDLFKIQFSAASALSKDPQTKLQQIMQLSQIGLITTDKIALYLDSPDLNDVYKGASAIQDAIDSCIQLAIEKDIIDIPEYIGYQQLLTQIIIEENQLFSSQDTESLTRIEKLKNKLLELMNEQGFVDLSNKPEAGNIEVTDEGLSAGAAQDMTGIAEQVNAIEPSDDLANPNQLGELNVNQSVS
jgi:hypothetical protein